MLVSGQQVETDAGERGPKARTRKLMLRAAIRLMQSGITPSVTEVAEAAEVSRATAYRYFPSQAALVQAVVDEALGPILKWHSADPDPKRRVRNLLETAMPRIDEFEATFRAALKLSLDQWARRQAGTLGSEPRLTRGHRVDLLNDVTAPLKGKVSPARRERLEQALSLIFGVEVLVVLKDIWGLTASEAQSVAEWAAAALIEVTAAEAETKIA